MVESAGRSEGPTPGVDTPARRSRPLRPARPQVPAPTGGRMTIESQPGAGGPSETVPSACGRRQRNLPAGRRGRARYRLPHLGRFRRGRRAAGRGERTVDVARTTCKRIVAFPISTPAPSTTTTRSPTPTWTRHPSPRHGQSADTARSTDRSCLGNGEQPQYADARCQTASCLRLRPTSARQGPLRAQARPERTRHRGSPPAGGTVTDSTGPQAPAPPLGSARQDQLDRLWSALARGVASFLTAARRGQVPGRPS